MKYIKMPSLLKPSLTQEFTNYKEKPMLKTSLSACITKFTDGEIALLKTSQQYLVSVGLKDRIKFFLEEEILHHKKCYQLHNNSQEHNCAILNKVMDKGSILVLVRMESGTVYGGFSRIGFISGVDYITDSQCCAIIMKSKDISVFELGNKLLCYNSEQISFGQYSTDLKIDLCDIDKSIIFRDPKILPKEHKSLEGGKVMEAKIYYNVLLNCNPLESLD